MANGDHRVICVGIDSNGKKMSRFYDDYDAEEFDDEVEYYAIRPNKTQIKKDIAALIELGKALAALPVDKRDDFDLPDVVRTTLDQIAKMQPSGARNRSLKYVAQHFYKMDVSSIQEKLAVLQNKSAHAVREHHLAEKWRDRLLTEGNDVLTELVGEFPGIDLQHIRQLIRQSKKESSLNHPPKSARLLYRSLKSAIESSEENEPDEGGESTDLSGY
jgi:ribosome-associated protein